MIAAGCSVHEVPEGGDDSTAVALSLNIILDEEMPLFTSVDFSIMSPTPLLNLSKQKRTSLPGPTPSASTLWTIT